jgi:hypothetical protein
MGMQKVGGYDWVIPVGVIAILGYAAYKFLGPSSALAANNSANDANNKAAADADYNASSAVVKQSMSDSQLSSIATQISNSFATGGTGDLDNVVYQLSLINNITDLYRLVQLFGSKSAGSGFFSTCSFLGFDCMSLDLDSFVRASLSADQLATVNRNFSGNGINYQF